MSPLKHLLLLGSLSICHVTLATNLSLQLDGGWDSQYISQGRDNLEQGGIYWGSATLQTGNMNSYVVVGRGDQQDYTEWNIGLEYAMVLAENLEANLGYQRIEIYGTERCYDNEWFAELAYTAVPWLIPSINYTYSTEATGYFVEISLHSYWDITDAFSLIPYVTQGLDFHYVTQAHNGRNHLQLGLEMNYQVSPSFALTGHISHVIAQSDITLEAEQENNQASLDQTYAGVHINWQF